MQIINEGNNIIVKIPTKLISKEFVKKFIERIEVETILKKSKLTRKQAWDLSEEIKNEFWKKSNLTKKLKSN